MSRLAPGGSRVRKLILDKVRLLGPTEHKEIFSLLQAHHIAYSSNSNGVFINLSTVPDDVLTTVKAFVDYCAMNKTGLDEYEKRLQECKITHRFDNISTLSEMCEPPPCPVDACPAPMPMAMAMAMAMPPPLPPPPPMPLPLPLSLPPPLPTQTHPSVTFSLGQRIQPPCPPCVNSLPSVLTNSRFQATKKRFARRKIVDKKNVSAGDGSGAEAAVLLPECYTYVSSTVCALNGSIPSDTDCSAGTTPASSIKMTHDRSIFLASSMTSMIAHLVTGVPSHGKQAVSETCQCEGGTSRDVTQECTVILGAVRTCASAG